MSQEKKNILRRTGIVGGFTLISRIFGLIRDIAIAFAFGASGIADAFFVAFRIPNLLRRFFAEGALTISFVPVFTDYLKKDREEARRVVDVSFTLLAIILLGIVALGVVTAPWIVKAIAYGFTEDSEKFALTVRLTRIMFPFILLISLAGLAMGVLNSLKHFAAPAAAPIMLNLGIISGALWLSQLTDPPVVGLALGVIIGGLFQFGIHLPVMAGQGMLPRFRLQWRHPSVGRIIPMMAASAYGAAVYQINVVVITFLASFLVEGSVSWLWYGDRIMEFPLGIFGISMATVLLPTLSDHASDGDREKLRETLNYGLRMTFFMTIPAMVGLIVLAEPITQLLFQRGDFTASDTHATAYALICFSVGLPFIAGVRVMTNAFFALKDSKTPVKMANLSVLANIILAVLLMKPMGHLGLALGISGAAAINYFLQVYAFQRKIGPVGYQELARSINKTLIASIVMGLGVSFIANWIGPFLDLSNLVYIIVYVFLLIFLGVGLYLLFLWLVKSKELFHVKIILKRK